VVVEVVAAEQDAALQEAQEAQEAQE